MFACFSKIIIIFVPLNFKNINDMKHLVKLMSEDCTYMCVINPDHIVKFYEEDDVCCIKLSTGETFATKVKLDDFKDLIEKSYL